MVLLTFDITTKHELQKEGSGVEPGSDGAWASCANILEGGLGRVLTASCQKHRRFK